MDEENRKEIGEADPDGASDSNESTKQRGSACCFIIFGVHNLDMIMLSPLMGYDILSMQEGLIRCRLFQ